MGDLEPITRNEKLWSGEDLTPVTRKEMYIKHLYDETQVIPEYPVTREEMFILKAGEELHDVTIEQLTATENKTYSEEGVAYSPVIVNVPLPENAYLLKEIEDVDIATFPDGSALPMSKLEVAIEPIQDLHGYDHPWVGGAGKNICSTNLNDWTIAQPYLYLKIPRFDNSIYTMSFVDKDTSVDISDTSIGFMNNFSAGDMTEFNWVVSNGVIRDNKTNVSIQHGINCDTIIIYRPTEAVFNKLFQRFYIQVEAGSTATDYEPYSNICPISGWTACNVVRTGKNLWDRDNIRRGVYTNSDGTTQSASASTNFSSQFIKIKPNTIYSITMFGESYENGSLFGVYYDEYKNGIKQTTNIQSLISNNSKTFTTPLNAHYIVFSGYRGVGTDIFTTANTVVCEGTPTTYEPYNGHTYTIDLDGTRYGGKVDLVSGVMTVDRVRVTVDENSNIISGSGGLPFRVDLLTGAKASSSASALTGVKCNLLKEVAQSSSWGVDSTFSRVTTDAKIVYFRVNSEITTIQQLKTFLQSNNLQFVYELATPLTIQLSPTVVKILRGMNNVYADSGNILDLSYLAKEE